MRRLFSVLSVLAIAHLLGLLGVVAWLAATERLNGERIESIREILHRPIPQEEAARRKASQEQQTGPPPQGVEAEPPPPRTPPLPAEHLVGLRLELRQSDEFRAQRMAREAHDLARTLLLERRRLDQERAAFEAERAAFERKLGEIAAIEGDEQFKAALSVLRQVKPAEAKQMLQQIIDGAGAPSPAGEAPELSGIERAVAYLDALGSMERGEIMSQFVKDSPELAAELLERLRTFGLMADASGEQGP